MGTERVIDEITKSINEAEVLSFEISKVLEGKNIGIIAMAIVALEEVIEKNSPGVFKETRDLMKVMRQP